ncbi:MAG: AraC family transcriptional regulator [Polyangiaceae bacterium]
MGPSLSPALLRRLLRARDRLREDPTLAPGLDQLAGDVGLSRAHFLRSFAAAFGVTPHALRTELRLTGAKRTLARGGSVTEACFDAGFSSLGSFSRRFTEAFGVAPREWQRRVRLVVPSADLWPAVWIPSCFLGQIAGGDAWSTFGEARPTNVGASSCGHPNKEPQP